MNVGPKWYLVKDATRSDCIARVAFAFLPGSALRGTGARKPRTVTACQAPTSAGGAVIGQEVAMSLATIGDVDRRLRQLCARRRAAIASGALADLPDLEDEIDVCLLRRAWLMRGDCEAAK